MGIKIFRRISSRGIKVVYPKFFRATVEAGEASASAPLGPLLGQLQVPLLEFCTSFNDYSAAEYYEFIDLRLQLTKKDLKYMYRIKYPAIGFVLHQFYFEYGLELEDLIYTHYGVVHADLWYLIHVYSAVWNMSLIQTSWIIFGSCYTSIIRTIY